MLSFLDLLSIVSSPAAALLTLVSLSLGHQFQSFVLRLRSFYVIFLAEVSQIWRDDAVTAIKGVA